MFEVYQEKIGVRQHQVDFHLHHKITAPAGVAAANPLQSDNPCTVRMEDLIQSACDQMPPTKSFSGPNKDQ